jgi:hypothetical protein
VDDKISQENALKKYPTLIEISSENLSLIISQILILMISNDKDFMFALIAALQKKNEKK